MTRAPSRVAWVACQAPFGEVKAEDASPVSVGRDAYYHIDHHSTDKFVIIGL
jgi:hypothetical protein